MSRRIPKGSSRLPSPLTALLLVRVLVPALRWPCPLLSAPPPLAPLHPHALSPPSPPCIMAAFVPFAAGVLQTAASRAPSRARPCRQRAPPAVRMAAAGPAGGPIGRRAALAALAAGVLGVASATTGPVWAADADGDWVTTPSGLKYKDGTTRDGWGGHAFLRDRGGGRPRRAMSWASGSRRVNELTSRRNQPLPLGTRGRVTVARGRLRAMPWTVVGAVWVSIAPAD